MAVGALMSRWVIFRQPGLQLSRVMFSSLTARSMSMFLLSMPAIAALCCIWIQRAILLELEYIQSIKAPPEYDEDLHSEASMKEYPVSH